MRELSRQCIVSRTKASPEELYRFVLDKGEVRFDPNRTLAGRGAYLLPTTEVFKKARQIRFWRQAFRMKSEENINYKELVGLLERLEQGFNQRNL